MTLVHVDPLQTIFGGLGPVRARIQATYWAGRGPFHEVVGDDVRFSVTLREDVEGPVVLDMAPTRGVCCVRWSITNLVGGQIVSRFTEIPDVPNVDFGDLIVVDPSTFQPSPDGQAAWDAAVAAASASVTAAESAATEAAVSASAAEGSAAAAAGSAATASASAASASASAGAADDAAQAAAVAQAAADVARDEAVAAEAAAGAARSDALAAEAAAELAATAAESARAGMIVGGSVVGDALILSTVDGGEVSAGDVRGPQGDEGAAATVAVGTVSTGAAGSSASVVNGGSASAAVLNFVIPRGAEGNPTPYELRGTGFPEGVVTAPVGTYYTDTSGTNGAHRWYKASGIGSTGWVVVFGDTGWRNISSLIVKADGVTPWPLTGTGRLTIRRTGNTVFVKSGRIILDRSADSTGSVLILTPEGFNPQLTYGDADNYLWPWWAWDRLNTYYLNHRTGGRAGANSAPANPFPTTTPLSVFTSHSWETAAAWPAALPGTPA